MEKRVILRFMVKMCCILPLIILSFIVIIRGVMWGIICPQQDIARVAIITISSMLPTLLLIRRKEAFPYEWAIRRVAHAILTPGIVFVLLHYFGWVQGLWWVHIIFVLLIYVGGNVFVYLEARKMATQLSKQIEAMKEKNER